MQRLAAKTAFVPWPAPLAAGLLIGAAAAAQLPRGAALASGAAGVLLGALTLLIRRAWPSALGRGAPLKLLAFVPLALLACGAALLRHAAINPGDSPAAPYYGKPITWRGKSDGVYLHATAPVRAKLALTYPRGSSAAHSPPTGTLIVKGVAEKPPAKRNPGGFDRESYLRRRGATAQLLVREVRGEQSGRLTLKERLARGATSGLAPEIAALMAAMTLGERDDLGELRDLFGRAGLAHLLALSGLHVGVLLLAFERLLAPTGRLRPALLAGLGSGYALLVGASPSVMRALVMSLALLLSRAFGAGRVQGATALTLAASVNLLIAPQMLGDLSFQLSYLAVAGILTFAARSASPAHPRKRGGGWRSAPRLALNGLHVSVAAQLPTLSVVASEFGTVPLLSPAVNLIAVPVAGLLVPVGFSAALLGLASPPLAGALNAVITAPLAGLLVGAAKLGALLPTLTWHEISALGHACFALSLLALAGLTRGYVTPKGALLVLLTAIGITAATPPRLAPPDAWILDVGQGDAVLLRTGGGNGILIDGGGAPFTGFDVGERTVLPALRALGITRLSAVINTHPDADHTLGLLPVLNSLPVGLLITGPPDDSSPLDAQLRSEATSRGIPVHVTRRGERIEVTRNVTLNILHPPATPTSISNEGSVAVLLEVRGAPKALFLGDLGAITEPELAVPPVEFLMVPHHGSRGGTSEALLRAAFPPGERLRAAVISVGKNSYGHPHPNTMGRLQAAGACILTTREVGAVRLALTGTPRAHGYLPSGAACRP